MHHFVNNIIFRTFILSLLLSIFFSGTINATNDDLIIEIKTIPKESVSFSASWRAGAGDWELIGEDPFEEDDEDGKSESESKDGHLIFRNVREINYFYGKEENGGEEDGVRKIKFTPEEKDLISRIDWSNQNLVEIIPQDLMGLEKLYRLDLSNNALEEIPLRDDSDPEIKGIGDFEDLRRLYIHNNSFEEKIPEEIKYLENLIVLSLHNNFFEGEVPVKVGVLENLEELYLHNNKLESFPSINWEDDDGEEIEGDLSNLTILTLKNNLLEEIPEEIFKFENLYSLDLKNNKLESLFDIFNEESNNNEEEPEMKLDKLEYLNVAGNFLGCDDDYVLPRELGDLKSMLELKRHHRIRNWHPKRISIDLRYNCLTEIPDTIGNLTALDSLKLDNNRIRGFSFLDEDDEVVKSFEDDDTKEAIPTTVGELGRNDDHLEFTLFSMYNNELEGEIPSEFGDLESLQVLRLQNNKLDGKIPESLLGLDNLTVLNLENNKINMLPEEESGPAGEETIEPFGNVTAGNLKFLFLGRNKLTHIPEGFGANNLNFLFLEENKLGEKELFGEEINELPDNFGSNFSSLHELTLQKNELENLPDNFGNLNQLYFLDLGSNSFEIFPETENEEMIVTDLSNLRYLNMSRQSETSKKGKMEGEIPDEITDLINLRILLLNNNKLDSIPGENASWGAMNNLNYLYLQGNEIKNLPKELGEVSNLRRLYLNNNKIEREMPDELTELSNLERLYLQHNDKDGDGITGELPEVTDWSNLERLFLDNNDISGGIHDEFLNNLNSLEYFSIFKNELSGNISDAIGTEMNSVRWWDISENELTGAIPEEIKKISDLEIFDFNNNRIAGVPNEINEAANLISLLGFENNISNFPQGDDGDLSSLRNSLNHLDFHENQITDWPEGIEELNNLIYFSFGENSMSGEVSWEDWSSNFPEDALFLNNNNLDGKFTDGDLEKTADLIFFDVRNNNFGGSLSDI